MTEFRRRIETTYADLRETDLVIDKAGNAWPIGEFQDGGSVLRFWLLDPTSKVKQHFMTRPKADTVTVSRVPSHADEAAKLEADVPKSTVPTSDGGVGTTMTTPTIGTTTTSDGETTTATISDNFATMEEAVAAVEEIGGTVEAEVTAEEVDAANAATEDAPVSLPSFGSMTPLEQRSHLFLLHGVLAYDLKSRDELAAMHVDAHRQHAEGKLKSKHVPHVHEAA